MSFTSASVQFVNDYLSDIALNQFRILGFRYEPQLNFNRQLREVVAEKSADFAIKHRHKKWLLIGYRRQPSTYQLKRTEVFSMPILAEDGSTVLFSADWKRRDVHTIVNYIFISPSAGLLEDLEEDVIVRDYGFSGYVDTCVNVYDENKVLKYTYPFNFLVNIERFEIQNFDHLDDQTEGVFSIFSMNAKINFPVYALDKVYDYTGICEKIVLTIETPGVKKDYEIISEE
jgi:hypothetical protein